MFSHQTGHFNGLQVTGQTALWSKPQCWIRFTSLGFLWIPGMDSGWMLDHVGPCWTFGWDFLIFFWAVFWWLFGWLFGCHGGHCHFRTLELPLELPLELSGSLASWQALGGWPMCIAAGAAAQRSSFRLLTFFKHQIGANMSQHILMFKHVQTIIYDLGEISPSVWWSFFVFSRALNWNGPRDWCGHCWIPSTIRCPWITSNWSLAIWENYRFYTSEHVDIKKIYISAFHTSPPILSVKTFKTWSPVSCHGGFGWPRPHPAGCRVLGERDTSTSAMGL